MADPQPAIRKLGAALLVLAAILLPTACTSDNRLGAIPTPPAEARELTADEMPIDPVAAAETFKASIGASTAEIRAYLFSTSTTFAQVAAYYENLLPGTWIEQASEALETARANGRGVTIWTNEDTNEVFSLQYIAAPGLEGNILIVIYAQRD